MEAAKAALVAQLREHALVIGEVTLTSGAQASYYVDAKRAILRPRGFAALAELVAAHATGIELTGTPPTEVAPQARACSATSSPRAMNASGSRIARLAST